MSRFNRDYELVIQTDGQDVTVRPPFKVVFDAQKSISGGLNRASIQVFGLGERTRLAVVKDPEQSKQIPVRLSVGYESGLELIFKGTVYRGQNRREGPDIVTDLDCLDGGFDYLTAFTSKTVRRDRVSAILADLPNTGRGKIGEVQELQRPKVLVGATMRLLDEIVDDGQDWFVNDEQLYIMRGDEVISRFIPVVNADSGLIGTPEREQQKITFETLMNPTLKLAGLCNIRSITAPHLNGVYRIDTINYSGDNYGQNWMQSVTAILAPQYKVI